MEALTSPEDYRLFDAARSIEFYTDPDRVPGLPTLPETSDWDMLSRAGSAGPREPMESVASRIEWPGPDRSGLPDIYLDFAYAGGPAASLFGECCEPDEASQELTMRLWRFRVTGHDGRTVECCFRAVLPRLSGSSAAGPHGMLFGTFTALDAQPFVEEV